MGLLQLQGGASGGAGLLGPPTRRQVHSNLPLHNEAAHGDLQLLRAAIHLHPDQLNILDAASCSALHRALSSGQDSCLRELLRVGADAELADAGGAKPLHRAAAAGRLEAVQLLLAAGAKVNAVDSAGRSALHMAVLGEYVSHERAYTQHAGHTECVHALLAAGADATAKDHSGMLPLDYASQGSHSACMAALAAACVGGLVDASTPLAGIQAPAPALHADDGEAWEVCAVPLFSARHNLRGGSPAPLFYYKPAFSILMHAYLHSIKPPALPLILAAPRAPSGV